MNAQQLSRVADGILDQAASGPFVYTTFSTVKAPKPIDNVGLGSAYRGVHKAKMLRVKGFGYVQIVTVVVLCRKMRHQDNNGRDMYQTPSGKVFVFREQEGGGVNYASFDRPAI